MSIYRASPYSDPNPAVEDSRFLDACRATASLLARGLHVYSPIVHSHAICEATGIMNRHWPGWYLHSSVMLTSSAALYVLPLLGWRESVGVQAEIEQARGMQLPIRYVDPVTYCISERPE